MQLTNSTCFKQRLGLDEAQSSSTTTNNNDFVFHAELGQQVRPSSGLQRRRLEDRRGMHFSTSSGN